ncbi:hypothetical protein K2173_008885 [Erythroxylum novogranatense]|uniref:Vinorine synthase-like n=1 Tax=Erythroxylum novogranatense TaxID=1862640 RepID=A0AAV8S4H9_9ROSI|nr:hypothetical protein K2173_008885 [Erythroxylum novogranatense]
MNLEVELLFHDLIKPTCPTPQHNRYHQVSCIDQMMLPIYMPWILYYPANDSKTKKEEICDSLKRSLSEALTIFYPLAGRFQANKFVDCNDEGVYFVEAKAKCNLLDILQNPNFYDINKLLPFEPDHASDMVAVKVTHFDCGGMSIGFGMSHQMGDALSSVLFLQSWAAISRGDNDTAIVPLFDSAKYFAPVDLPEFDTGFEYIKEAVVTKRFVFDASSLSALRDRYVYRNNIHEETIRPTRIEALTAFLWSRIKTITQVKASTNKVFTAYHPVNLRPRLNPPLSAQHFRNIIVEPEIVEIVDNSRESWSDDLMVRKVRETVRKVNAEYVKNLQADNAYFHMMNERSEKTIKGEVVPFNFTSCCRFPIYDIDFGWGKPTWVSSGKWPFGNFAAFFDTKEGGGIEAWITVLRQEMARLETDPELIALLSPKHKH